jgi:hypothetical protein
MPARATFIGGLYPHSHGVWRNAGSLPAENEALFQRTAHLGKVVTAYVQNYSDERPMCLFVGFPGPHEPWDPLELLR